MLLGLWRLLAPLSLSLVSCGARKGWVGLPKRPWAPAVSGTQHLQGRGGPRRGRIPIGGALLPPGGAKRLSSPPSFLGDPRASQYPPSLGPTGVSRPTWRSDLLP